MTSRVSLSSSRSSSSRLKMMAIGNPMRVSSEDWVLCIRSLPSSRILKRTSSFISFFTAWSFVVTLFFKLSKLTLHIPATVHSLLGPALSLLLVFRTNSSYDRFWEGRKSQSLIVGSCRNIASHGYCHIPPQHHRQLAALLTSYVLIQKQHLQGVIADDEIAPLLTKQEVQDIQKKRNRPIYLLRLLEQFIFDKLKEKYRTPGASDPEMPKYIEKHFIESLHQLHAQLAACERIIKQPVPLSYSRHLSRFLTLYCFLLPFSLTTSLGWFTVPTVSAVCWALVSIQEIAVFIEEPFDKKTQIIPLNQIAMVVRSDVCELLDGVLESSSLDLVAAKLKEETLTNSRSLSAAETEMGAYYFSAG